MCRLVLRDHWLWTEARTERQVQQGPGWVWGEVPANAGVRQEGSGVVPQHPAEMAARMEVGRGSWVQLRAVEGGQAWGGGGELGMPSVLGGLLPPSSPPPPHLGPLSHLPLQPAAGDAIRIPLIAFFHPVPFPAANGRLMPPLSWN